MPYAFKSDNALLKSRYSQLNECRFLEKTSHYDNDDQMMCQVAKVEWYEKAKGEMYIVAHRIPCKAQQGYYVDNPEEDFISINDATQYTGFTNPSTAE